MGGCGASALGRYETAFRENEIDEKVLPNLTEEDLKDAGSHRRAPSNLLDAIAALRMMLAAERPR